MYEFYHSEERQLTPPSAPPFGWQFGSPFGQQFAPPFGQQPGLPPVFPGASSGPPSGPPPSFIPQQTPSVFAVDPGAIRPCLFRFVYIWLNTGEQFWAWLLFVGPRSAAGWRWTGFRWIYFGVDLRNIRSFVCQ